MLTLPRRLREGGQTDAGRDVGSELAEGSLHGDVGRVDLRFGTGCAEPDPLDDEILPRRIRVSGETDLDTLLRSMSAVLFDGIFVFATVDGDEVPEGVTPRMMFQETEGTTLILEKDYAEAAGIAYEFPSRMITLNIHSSLEAVGFMARISTALAAEGMGVNPVSGFYHDHLFVPDGREADAMRVLQAVADQNA